MSSAAVNRVRIVKRHARNRNTHTRDTERRNRALEGPPSLTSALAVDCQGVASKESEANGSPNVGLKPSYQDPFRYPILPLWGGSQSGCVHLLDPTQHLGHVGIDIAKRGDHKKNG